MADEGYGVAITFDSGFFGEINNVEGPSMSREAIDTSHAGTTGGFRTFQPSDLVDHGEVEVTIAFDPDQEPPIDQAAETVTITYPIPSGMSSGATWQFSGFMTGATPTVPFDDKMTMSATLKVSGDITYTPAA